MSFYHQYVNFTDIQQTPIVIAVALIALSIIYYWIKNRGVLPGPNGVPYLGLYPFLSDENIVQKLEEYKKKYGDMFSFTYTGTLFINLGSIKAMREIQLQKSDCFYERFKDVTIFSDFQSKGLFMMNGEQWKVLRKFFVQKFKEYGLSTVRNDSASSVYDSLNAAIEDIKSSHGKPINIADFLSKHCAVTMRKILFGEKGVTDQEISKMLFAFAEAVEGHGAVNNLLAGSIAKFLYITKPAFRENLKHGKAMTKMAWNCTKRIESSMIESDPTCIIEEYFKERNERRRNKDPSWKLFTDEALVESLLQLVGDGIGSVAAFIGIVLNSLSVHTQEQEKVYSEIMEMVGSNRDPTVEDKTQLPYTNAVLNECVRTCRFLIFFPSLECTKETTVRGHRIPVGAVTLLNFWSANHDPETYEEPYAFKPSRYLSTGGKPKAESPVLFGMGKRVCTGEPYVMLQSFLFLTTIVKYFKVIPSGASKDETIDFFPAGKRELTFIPRKGN